MGTSLSTFDMVRRPANSPGRHGRNFGKCQHQGVSFWGTLRHHIIISICVAIKMNFTINGISVSIHQPLYQLDIRHGSTAGENFPRVDMGKSLECHHSSVSYWESHASSYLRASRSIYYIIKRASIIQIILICINSSFVGRQCHHRAPSDRFWEFSPPLPIISSTSTFYKTSDLNLYVYALPHSENADSASVLLLASRALRPFCQLERRLDNIVKKGITATRHGASRHPSKFITDYYPTAEFRLSNSLSQAIKQKLYEPSHVSLSTITPFMVSMTDRVVREELRLRYSQGPDSSILCVHGHRNVYARTNLD